MNSRVNKIFQIVPRLPPLTDGVGDYALNLARQLRQDHKTQTHFIVCDRAWKGNSTIDGFSISHLSSNSAEALSSLLWREQVRTVLLHYVGYGYAQRGCPTWLLDGLETWHIDNDKSKLVTMFHEVYAAGKPPWTSAFWLSGWQKRLAGRLVVLSDRIVTNRYANAKILSAIGKTNIGSIQVNPVFSNVGELQSILPLERRKKRLIIFGHANSRLQIYQHYLSHLERICNIFAIEEIYDIGNPAKLNFNLIKQLNIIETGTLSAEQIGKIFTNSLAGFMSFPPLDYLGKSTIFAAYCAYGLLPIIPAITTHNIDGLKANQNYLALPDFKANVSFKTAKLIADNAYQWYQNHSLKQQAKSFANLFD